MNRHTANWYAFYTKPRAEKIVHEELGYKGIESYLPLIKTLKQWSDRKKWVKEPLFKSYVFVKLTTQDYYNVLNISGVVRCIHFSGKPTPIPENQIDLVRKLLSKDFVFEIVTERIKVGEEVEIILGSFMGFRGRLVAEKGKRRVAVALEQLGCTVLINIDIALLKPLEKASISC